MIVDQDEILTFVERYQLFTADDVMYLILAMLFVVFVSSLIFVFLYFIPSFIKSVIKSVKNKSIIYSDSESLNTTLDLKSMIFKYKNGRDN